MTGGIDELNVYVDGSSVPSSLTIGLYSTSSGRPKSRMTTCTISAPKAGWNACRAASAGVVEGIQYWLAVLSPAGRGKMAFRDRPRDGSVSYSSSSSSLTALPTSFPVGSKRNGYSPASIFGARAASAPVDVTPPVDGTPPVDDTPPVDVTPPSTPSGLAKTSATVSSVSLSWGASSDGSGVAGYRVYRDDVLAGAGAATSAVVSGLACGTSYVFAVEAYDTAGNTSPRASLATVTAACQPAPDTRAPSAPQGMGWTTISQNSIGVKWNAATDDTGVAGYRVYRDGTAAGTTQSLSYTVGGLQCGNVLHDRGRGLRRGRQRLQPRRRQRHDQHRRVPGAVAHPDPVPSPSPTPIVLRRRRRTARRRASRPPPAAARSRSTGMT